MRRVCAAAMALLLFCSLLLPLSALGYEGVTTTDFPLLDEETAQPTAGIAAPEGDLAVAAKSAILLEQSTGTVLYEMDADVQMPPASITKVMTLLLVMEAIDAGKFGYDDQVSASEYACAMGGSQIWLEPGETMTVDELLKATAISSANDAAAALGEYVAGSPDAFINMMNERAAQLGMKNTHFVNPNGLDAEGHVSSARDIAIMSCELLKHPDITKYSTVWMDSLRGGATQLVNTNKLVRFYEGATGLKTGSTDSALYCLSGTAERDGMELIAVIMKDATSAQRFADAQTLLNYGFSTYALKHVAPETPLSPVPVTLGTQATVQPVLGDGGTLLLEEAKAGDLQQTVTLSAGVKAPVALGDQLGMLTVSSGEEVVAEIPLLAGEEVPRITYGQMLLRLLRLALLSD